MIIHLKLGNSFLMWLIFHDRCLQLEKFSRVGRACHPRSDSRDLSLENQLQELTIATKPSIYSYNKRLLPNAIPVKNVASDSWSGELGRPGKLAFVCAHEEAMADEVIAKDLSSRVIGRPVWIGSIFIAQS